MNLMKWMLASATVLSGFSAGTACTLSKENCANLKVEQAFLDKVSNPWGLVYEGALKKNEKGRVNIHPVTYVLRGVEISANVYTPASYGEESGKKFPAIVVAHPNGGVKEQVAGLMAQSLAEAGFIAVTADASYQGASGGVPRGTDIPENRINDIRGMVDFISEYPGVDASRIGALGICGGGGYTLGAAQSDKRIKAVATLSMFNSGRVRRNGFQDSDVKSIAERLAKAAKAREKRITDGEVVYVGDMGGVSDEAAAKLPFALYRDGFVYYLRTHAHPNSTFRYTEESLMSLMMWDAENRMDLITQPLLMICGRSADTRYMTDDAFAKATGTKDKELFLVEGARHIETYHVRKYVEEEKTKLSAFFKAKL